MCVTSEILIGIIPFYILFSQSIYAGFIGVFGILSRTGLNDFLITIFAFTNLGALNAWAYLAIYRKTRHPKIFINLFGFSVVSMLVFTVTNSIDRGLNGDVLFFAVTYSLIAILYAKYIFMLSLPSEVQP